MLTLESIPLLKPVLILEDEKIMRERLTQILISIGYQAEDFIFAESLQICQDKLKAIKPAMALIDLHLPDGNGLSSVDTLIQINPEIPIIVISAWCDESTILEALKKGATGYLLKERDDVELLLAIRNVLQGGVPIDPFIAQYLIQKSTNPPLITPKMPPPRSSNTFNLTDREKEVLSFIAQGMSNKEIADMLYVSKNTVETHIRNCYKKLFVSNRTMAAHKARSNGII